MGLDERDREPERPLPAGGQGPRALPDRAGRDEVPLPGHPAPGPDRERPGTMDDEVEASPERVRHHLPRPLAGSRNLLMKTARNTVPVTDPTERALALDIVRHLSGRRMDRMPQRAVISQGKYRSVGEEYAIPSINEPVLMDD